MVKGSDFTPATNVNKLDRVYFPGLNGLRALAALAVVLSHITISLEQFKLDSHLIGTLPNGNARGIDLADYGVSIFFSLSGFLITYLLIQEKENGGIDVSNFYIRRILRIWPLYYLYFLVASLIIALWRVPHESFYNLFYVFFSANIPKIFQLKSELLGHYWSLGVEEQFYLFWPWWVIVFYRKLYSRTIILLALLIGTKIVAHFYFPDTLFETAMYVNRFDCMLIGALGAMLYYRKKRWFIFATTALPTQVIAWTCIILAAGNKFHLASILDQEIMCFITVALIMGQIAVKSPVINLERPALDRLGRLSYGIYVIHPVVIFLLAKLWSGVHYPPTVLHYCIVFILAASLTVLLAFLSYEYFEKFFLAVKSRFSGLNKMKPSGE